MSLGKDEAHEKSAKFVQVFKELNVNTVHALQERSEEDKKKKIWRLNVVKRDENASEIIHHLKTAKQVRKKDDSYKKGKIPSSKPEKLYTTPKKPAVPKKKPAKVVKPYIPENVPTVKPVYGVTTRTQLKEDSLIGNVWKLHLEGKSHKEISEELGTLLNAVKWCVYRRRRQLGIITPKRIYPHKGKIKEGTKTNEYYDLYKQGFSNQEIADKTNSSVIAVSSALSVRRKFLGEPIKSKEIGKKVAFFKKQKLTLREVAEQMGMEVNKIKYFYYDYYNKKKKLKNGTKRKS